MLRFVSILFVVLCLATPTPARAQLEKPQFPRWPLLLQDEVMKMYQSGFSGQIHLYVKDLASGARYTHNAATPTYIASVVKILFLVELFDQIERGELSLDDYVEFTPQDVRSGSPLFNYLPVGARLPIRVLAEAMIQQSDNTASDLVAKKVGLARINGGLKARGYTGFGQITRLLDVRRLVYGQLDSRILSFTPRQFRSVDFAKGGEAKAKKISDLLKESDHYITPIKIDRAYRKYYVRGYNSATMESVGRLLEDLYLGDVVSSTASRSMIEILRGTQTGSGRISAYLPPQTPIAHKTGTQYRRTCDVALIETPSKSSFIFAACIKGSKGVKRDEVIARLAYKAYSLITQPNLSLLNTGVNSSKKGKKRKRRRKSKKRKRTL
jgi:beta-lactamase class A